MNLHWPQTFILVWFGLRAVAQLHSDFKRPNEYARTVGVISSVMANGLPLLVLYLGGFFDQH